MKDLSILFENEEILIVNKPYGVSVQGGAGVSHPLDEELSKMLGYKIYLVHRLDKETVGILIVAKSPKAASKWTSMIASDKVKKEYYAICIGSPVVNGKKSRQGTINGVLQAHGREMSAQTHFEVEKECVLHQSITSGETEKTVDVPLSLVHITLGTGRMHQIRIQMAKNEAPLAGDDQHGNFKINKIIRRAGIKKLCLASTKLTVCMDGKDYVFEIKLPEHMQSIVDKYFN